MITLKHLYYGWFIALIATCVLAMQGLIFYSFGIFLKPLTTEFGWERGALSVALSMNGVVAGAFAILAGRLSDKYGPRILVTANGLLAGIGFLLLSQISSLWQVYLIWGLPLGVGGACGFIPLMSVIPRWFVKKRGIAIGIAVAGFGLGGIISPPIAQWLISTYGWRQAYLVLGLVILTVVTPLAQFLKHSPQRIGLKPYGENETVKDKQSLASAAEGFSFKQAIKTGHFWLFGSIMLCFLFALQAMLIHIVPYALDIEVPAIVAASILSIIAGSSIIGKLSVGFISDKIGTRKALTACLVTVTLALIWLLFLRDVWMFYLFAAFFGIAYGGIISLNTIIPAELFGLKFLGMILASLMLFFTIGGAVGAPVAGYIFDVTRSYSLAFIICVILCALALALSLVLLCSKGKEGVAVTE